MGGDQRVQRAVPLLEDSDLPEVLQDVPDGSPIGVPED